MFQIFFFCDGSPKELHSIGTLNQTKRSAASEEPSTAQSQLVQALFEVVYIIEGANNSSKEFDMHYVVKDAKSSEKFIFDIIIASNGLCLYSPVYIVCSW